jgi:hypothetical protein
MTRHRPKNSQRSRQEAHPLVGNRPSSALGLASLGGIGIGLMVGKVMVLFGLFIVLGSAIAILSLHFRSVRLAYGALRDRTKYKGDIRELLTTAGLGILLICVSVPLYFIVTAQDFVLSRARFTYENIAVLKAPGQSTNYFNLDTKNAGALAAEHPSIAVGGQVIEGPLLSKEDVDLAFNDLHEKLRKSRKLNVSMQVQPNASSIATIPNVLLSDQEWGKVTEGRAVLYFYIAMIYDDEVIAPSGYSWVFETCGYYTVTTAYYHLCVSHNAITKVKNSVLEVGFPPSEGQAHYDRSDTTSALP